MPKIEIKPYTEFYEQQVFELILKIQNDEFGVPMTVKDQPDLESISLTYQKDLGNFWVALDGKNVVGTIALIDIGNYQSALKKMYVDKNYRGKERSIAKSLLENLLDWCKSKDIREIYLGTTLFFLAAQKFYEKNGFNEITRERLPVSFPVTKYNSRFYLYRVK